MKRFLKIFGILTLLLTSFLLVAWFVLIPQWAMRFIGEQSEGIKEKMSREVHVEGFSLTSFKSFRLNDASLTDLIAENNTKPPVAWFSQEAELILEQLPLTLEKVKFDQIILKNNEIFLRKSQGVYNFSDLLNRFLKPGGASKDIIKESHGLMRYITSDTEVVLKNTTVQFEAPLKFLDITVSTALLPDVRISRKNHIFHIQGDLQLILEHQRETLRYDLGFEAHLKNAKQGNIQITPKNPELPRYLTTHIQRDIFIQRMDVQLPATFTAYNLFMRHAKTQSSEFKAHSVRARFMTFPPQKVQGVYVKTLEIDSPELSINFEGDSTNFHQLYASLTSLKKSPQKAPVDENTQEKLAAPSEVSELAKSGDIQAFVKAYPALFFAQKIFTHDASIHIADNHTPALGELSIYIPNLEVGFRTFRNLINWDFDIKTTGILQLDAASTGFFSLRHRKAEADLKLASLAYGSQSRVFKQNFLEKYNHLEKLESKYLKYIKILQSVLPWLEVKESFHASGETAVKLDFIAQTADAQVHAKLEDFALQNERLASEPVSLSLESRFKAHFAPAKHNLSITDIALTAHGVKATAEASIAWKQEPTTTRHKKDSEQNALDTHFYLTASIPQQDAQTVFNAIPSAFRSALSGLTFEGTLGTEFKAEGWLSQLKDMVLENNIVLSEDFDAIAFPVDRNMFDLNRGFVLDVQDPNALLPHQILIPPSIYPIYSKIDPLQFNYNPVVTAEDIREKYPTWVLFEDLNPWLIQLITTTEDGNFFNHKGFSPLQIKAALDKNVKKGQFYRGASTISMQLIKNIFFNRDKTLSRKAQEVIYTWLMENVLRIPKQRILELYFNIIEFGPEIYGIQEAAKYYFGKQSQDLTLKESAFLMAIIPSPRKGALHRPKQALHPSMEKTITWYISEMYRRKCDKKSLQKMKDRYAKLNQPIPFVPCCPSPEHLERLKAEPLSFYMPVPEDPLAYALRPDLYNPDETPIFVRTPQACGASLSTESNFLNVFNDEPQLLPLQDSSPWQ